jgi:cytochrome c oxidase cbb3-type subunit 3
MRSMIAALTLVASAICASQARCQPQNPREQTATGTKSALSAGKRIFENHCALCHGFDGAGGRGPSLRRPKLNRVIDDAALRSLIQNGISPEMPPGWFLSAEDVANVAAFVLSIGRVAPEKLPGDPVRGRAVYERSRCATCHILAGEGAGFGPELTEIGARRGAGRLRDTLKNPASTIPDGFLLIEAVTPDGKTVRGIRVNEDTFSIQVKTDEGPLYSFRKSGLKSLTKLRGETPMPAYESIMSAAEMDDLIAYLAAQKGKS